MASNSYFLSYWGTYCKDAFKQLIWGDDQGLKYSEGLLNTLYYETDVGCIPRGIKLDSGGTTPKYGNSDNWNKQIEGCYWCVDDDTSWNGICCSKECLFYLHDWCIERVEHFTKRKFCRLPGCDESVAKGKDHLYCDGIHKAKFDGTFPQWINHKSLQKKVIREGPNWYISDQTISGTNLKNSMSGKNVKTNSNVMNSSKSSEKTKVNKTQPVGEKKKYVMNFPIRLRDAMIFKTDIGLIPRVTPDKHQWSSLYSSSHNWIRKIKGCYQCGSKTVTPTGDSNFCRLLCYFVFYEWCRRFVESHASIKMCKNTGCDRDAASGFACCNKEHTLALEEKYSQVKSIDLERLIKLGPSWYQRGDFPQYIKTTQACQAQQTHTPQQYPTIAPGQHNSPSFPTNMVFSWDLTQVLFYCTDVGPIPREISSFMSPPPALSPIQIVNWNVPIYQCYWCSIMPIQSHISCSRRCFYLLNEWIHNKYTQTTQNRLCRVLGCNSPPAKGFDCCNRAHSVQYNEFKEYSPLLKSTEFALGPRWYQDFSAQHIDFYNRDEPFYELTNFYACNSLVIDGISWPTTEHYFQANKFAGTPYLRYISCLQAPRDAFDFSRNPGVQRWIRSHWPTIKINVMLKALRHKYIQNRDLADILFRTGSKHIYEHTKNDKFWGDGGDNRNGTNKLGELLMVVRGELQSGRLIPMMNNSMQHFQMDNNMNSPQLIHNPHIDATVIPQQQTNVFGNKTQHNSPAKVVQNDNQLPINKPNQLVDIITVNESHIQSQGANLGGKSLDTPPKETKADFKADLKFDTKVPVTNDLKTENVENIPNICTPLFTQGEGMIPLPEDYTPPFNIVSENPDHTGMTSDTDPNMSDSQPNESPGYTETNPFYHDIRDSKESETVNNKHNPFSPSVVSAETVQHGNSNTIQSPTSGMHPNGQNTPEANTMEAVTMPGSDDAMIQPLIDLSPINGVLENFTIDSPPATINFNLAHVKYQSQSTDTEAEQHVSSPTKPPESTDDNNENSMDTTN